MKKKKQGDKIIFPESPEAATYRTDVCGWVSRDGIFCGDGQSGEYAARDRGCTHVLCKRCGTPTPKHCVLCEACCDKKDAERYAALPRAKWDGKAPLYSEVTDRFYNTLDEAEHDALGDGKTLADLRLVICEPVYAPELGMDYCSDELADGHDIPGPIIDAIEEFNRAIAGVIVSWMPGMTALDTGDDR